jgi:hypothetical protein
MTYFMTFMTASLDSADSQCILRSERHVTSCRGGQVELVVWLAQMVPAMPSILGDHSWIRTWSDMAVVQDGAATAARAGKPKRAAVVSISAPERSEPR